MKKERENLRVGGIRVTATAPHFGSCHRDHGGKPWGNQSTPPPTAASREAIHPLMAAAIGRGLTKECH